MTANAEEFRTLKFVKNSRLFVLIRVMKKTPSRSIRAHSRYEKNTFAFYFCLT